MLISLNLRPDPVVWSRGIRVNGVVEVDETYVGGDEEGARGRYTLRKAIVAVAVEIVDGRRLGRVRMRRVSDVSAESLEPFVSDMIESGSSILIDGWSAYSGLARLGYDHVVIHQCQACTAWPR